VLDNPFVSIGLPIGLFVIMVGIGLTLAVDDFRRESAAPRAALVGLGGQLMLMPALGFAVVALLDLPPEIAVGLIIAAACPGGSTSNLFAYLARANVALSIVLTVLASLITIATLPVYAGIALRNRPLADDVVVTMPVADTVTLLLAIVLVPVTIGMVVKARAPERAAALERGVSAFGAAVLVLLIVAIAWSVREDIVELTVAAGPAALLLNVSGVLGAFALGALTGLSRADRVTVAIELGVKNTTIGILIAVSVIGIEEVAVPSAVYGLLMYGTAFAMVGWARRWTEQRAR
jgi:BASS family bile acid:Na+ symporter